MTFFGEIRERITRGKRWTRAEFESPSFSVDSVSCDHNPDTEPFDGECPSCWMHLDTDVDQSWVKPGTEPRPWVDADEPEPWLLHDDDEED